MGLRIPDLAAQAGVNRSFIYDVIRERSLNPAADKLAKVAGVLKVDVDWLLTGEGRIENPPDWLAGDDPFITIRFIRAAMSQDGERIVEDDVADGEPYRFSKTWLRHSFGVSPDKLRLVHVMGDSMEPTLRDGDVVLVDLTRKAPTPPGVFVVFDGAGLAAKRLDNIPASDPPKARILSDNPRYGAFERTADEVKIIGRVRWAGRQL